MKLLIDSGNSRLKWALLDEHDQLSTFAIANQTVTSTQLMSEWSVYSPPEQVLISSVATNTLLFLLTEVVTQLWPNVQLSVVKSQAQAYGVSNAYEEANRLGVDRWLALIAAHHYYPSTCCVVDCGTAITIDVINADGTHQGGLISPGLVLMKKALAQDTASLPYDPTLFPVGLANTTGAGIYNGTLYAAIGLIERVLRQQPSENQLIMTGGDAEQIAAQLNIPFILDANLVFKGLAVLAKQTGD